MADESDLEKTEAASPRRLERRARRGRSRVPELGTFMMLAAGVAAIWLGGGSLYRGLSGCCATAWPSTSACRWIRA